MPKNKVFNCHPGEDIKQFFDIQTNNNKVFMLTRNHLFVKLFIESEFTESIVIDLPDTKHPLIKMTVIS